MQGWGGCKFTQNENKMVQCMPKHNTSVMLCHFKQWLSNA